MTMIVLSLESFLSARCASTDWPLRIKWRQPSAQPMQSGRPSDVTGTYTTPSTGIVFCSSPTHTADPFKPFKKSLVPSLGSTTQHQACPVRRCPVSSPHKSQLSKLRSSGRSAAATIYRSLGARHLQPTDAAQWRLFNFLGFFAGSAHIDWGLYVKHGNFLNLQSLE